MASQLSALFAVTGSPILGRELRSFLRSYKAFLALFFFQSALLLVVLSRWEMFVQFFAPDRNIYQGSLSFFYWIAIGHMGFLSLLAPILMAPTIAIEREQETFPLLLSSPVSGVHILLTKYITPILYLALLLTAALPFLALPFLGGGLSGLDMAGAYWVMMLTVILYGSVGLFCSTLRSRVHEVYLITLVMVAGLIFFIPYHGTIWHYLTTLRWEGLSTMNHGIHWFSPLYVLSEVIFPTAGAQQQQVTFIAPWSFFTAEGATRLSVPNSLAGFTFYALAGTVVFLGLSHLRLWQIARGDAWFPPKQSDEEEQDETPPGQPDLEAIYQRHAEVSFQSTSSEGNPATVLERRIQWFARLPVLFRLFYCAILLSVLMLPLASYQGSWLFFSLPFVAAAFFTLPLAATSISSDHERSTLDLLRTTLLSSRQIVSAKFVTNMQYSFLLALALYLPGMIIQFIFAFVIDFEVDLITSQSDVIALLCYPLILLCALAFYTAVGLWSSAYFMQSNHSMLCAGLVVLGSLLAPLFIAPIQTQALPGLEEMLSGVFFVSPLTSVTSLFPAGNIRMLDSLIRLLAPWQSMAYSFVFIQCMLFLILSGWLLRQTAQRLDARR